MLVQASQGQSGSAHVVVLGNEKGGSGKSTTALHIAVALMKAGQRVATIDLDCRQQSFTRYIGNRSAWARRTGLDLEIPVHWETPGRGAPPPPSISNPRFPIASSSATRGRSLKTRRRVPAICRCRRQ